MRKRRRKNSFILTVALLAIVGYFVISLVQLQIEINTQKKVVQDTQMQLQQQEMANAELQRMLESGDEEDLIERVARDSLGYVMPDEKVYYDVSPGG